MSTPVTFSTPQACALADITFRQLDHWIRTDRLRPHCIGKGSGSRRRLSVRDVQIAWLLGVLTKLDVGGGKGLPDTHLLYALVRWQGWFVAAPGKTVTVLDNRDELANWPIAVVVDLTSCTIFETTPMRAVSA